MAPSKHHQVAFANHMLPQAATQRRALYLLSCAFIPPPRITVPRVTVRTWLMQDQQPAPGHCVDVAMQLLHTALYHAHSDLRSGC